VLDLAVLGLLKEKPMYGYELKKALDERVGRSASFGSLYPTLKRLAKRGLVASDMPRAEAGRKKNVYRITPSGENEFTRIIETCGPNAGEDRDDFMIRLAFFKWTPPETRKRLLERRRGHLQDRLENLRGSLRTLRERMDAYALELMQHEAGEAERGIRWLERMLEDERTTDGEPAPHGA
jgi:DNA-binding PadR family transcriptional regulator